MQLEFKDNSLWIACPTPPVGKTMIFSCFHGQFAGYMGNFSRAIHLGNWHCVYILLLLLFALPCEHGLWVRKRNWIRIDQAAEPCKIQVHTVHVHTKTTACRFYVTKPQSTHFETWLSLAIQVHMEVALSFPWQGMPTGSEKISICGPPRPHHVPVIFEMQNTQRELRSSSSSVSAKTSVFISPLTFQ